MEPVEPKSVKFPGFPLEPLETPIEDDEDEDESEGVASSSLFSEKEPIPSTSQEKPQDAPLPTFICDTCGFSETYHYKGKKAPFVQNIVFSEPYYVMKDPFGPPPSSESKKSSSEYFLILGTECTVCYRTVCRSEDCSFYYHRTYCLPCADKYSSDFPQEVQTKLRKQLANVK